MKLARPLLILGIAAVALGFVAIREYDADSPSVREVKAWAASDVVPRIEAFHAAKGHYPQSLSELPSFQLSEKAGKMAFVYGAWPDGHYELAFSPDDVLCLTARWDYHSSKKTWSLDR